MCYQTVPLLHFLDSPLQTTKDYITVLLGGTNDTFHENFTDLYEELENKLVTLSQRKLVLISTIPTRFDKKILDPLHSKMDLLNNYTREVTARLNQVIS